MRHGNSLSWSMARKTERCFMLVCDELNIGL